jgi:hypothetical protein
MVIAHKLNATPRFVSVRKVTKMEVPVLSEDWDAQFKDSSLEKNPKPNQKSLLEQEFDPLKVKCIHPLWCEPRLQPALMPPAPRAWGQRGLPKPSGSGPTAHCWAPCEH